MITKLILLILLPFSVLASTSFESVMKSMKPVDAEAVLETHVTDPLYRSLQVQYRTAGHDRYEIGGAGRATVKVNLLAWGQREQESELNREYEKLSEMLGREGHGSECFYRGLLWTNAFTTSSSLRIMNRLESYYQDEAKILKRGIGENLFEFKELLTLKEEDVKNRLRMAELKNKLQAIEKSLNQRLENQTSIQDLNYSTFINVDSIKKKSSSSEPRLVELEKLKRLAKIHSLELEIEKKESNQIFDNVELYRWNDNRNYGISYGVQFTFNIPFLNKRTYMKDAVQRQVAINKFTESQRDFISKTEGTDAGFTHSISQYEALRDSDYFQVLKEMKKLLAGSRNNSPLMILQTKVKMAKEKLKRLELRHDISVQYLERLLYSGDLSNCQDQNFLVRN